MIENYVDLISKDELIAALNQAIYADNLEIAKLLFNNGLEIDYRTLNMITSRPARQKIRDYIQKNINKQDGQGWTALIHAVCNNQIDIAKNLLEKGCDSNITAKNLNTALTYASEKGNTEIVKLLLTFGSLIDHSIKRD